MRVLLLNQRQLVLRREHVGARLFGFCLENFSTTAEERASLRLVELLNRIQPRNSISRIACSHLAASAGDALRVETTAKSRDVSAELILRSTDGQSQIVHPSQQDENKFSFHVPL